MDFERKKNIKYNINVKKDYEDSFKEKKIKNNRDNNIDNEGIETEDEVIVDDKTNQYALFENELNEYKIDRKEKKLIQDNNTGMEMDDITDFVGSKQFNTFISPNTIDVGGDIHKARLVKMVRNNDEKLIKKDEIDKYISIKKGKLVFNKEVSPKTLYKIAKSINKEFYFIMLDNDNIIPASKFNVEKIFKNNAVMELNINSHIKSITDKKNNKYNPTKLEDVFFDWFSKNVKHPHPYTYSDMVITDMVKNGRYITKDDDGNEILVHTHYTNELADKFLSENNIEDLEEFGYKCQTAFYKTQNDGEERKFAFQFPLYKQHHMLSVTLHFKLDGSIECKVYNANGIDEALKKYALPIGNMIQKMFEEYTDIQPIITNYIFCEQDTQIGGTCMTHADYNARQNLKNKTTNKPINHIRICEKAFFRGVASTLQQKAEEQDKFVGNDMRKIEKKRTYNSSNYYGARKKTNIKKNRKRKFKMNNRKIRFNSKTWGNLMTKERRKRKNISKKDEKYIELQKNRQQKSRYNSKNINYIKKNNRYYTR